MAVAVSGGHGIGGDGGALLTLVAGGEGVQPTTGAGVYALPINMAYGEGYALSSVASFTIQFTFATSAKAAVMGSGAATGIVKATGNSTALVSGAGAYNINLVFSALAQIGTEGVVGGTGAFSIPIVSSAIGVAASAGQSALRIVVKPTASGVVGVAGNCAFKLVPIVRGAGARGHILSGAANIKLSALGVARRGNSGSSTFRIELVPSATGIAKPLFSGVGGFIINIGADGFGSTLVEYQDADTIYVKPRMNLMSVRL